MHGGGKGIGGKRETAKVHPRRGSKLRQVVCIVAVPAANSMNNAHRREKNAQSTPTCTRTPPRCFASKQMHTAFEHLHVVCAPFKKLTTAAAFSGTATDFRAAHTLRHAHARRQRHIMETTTTTQQSSEVSAAVLNTRRLGHRRDAIKTKTKVRPPPQAPSTTTTRRTTTTETQRTTHAHLVKVQEPLGDGHRCGKVQAVLAGVDPRGRLARREHDPLLPAGHGGVPGARAVGVDVEGGPGPGGAGDEPAVVGAAVFAQGGKQIVLRTKARRGEGGKRVRPLTQPCKIFIDNPT